MLSAYLLFSFSCKRPSNAVEEEHPFALEKGPQVFYPARSFQPGLADLDSDGDLDIFVANFVSGSNEIWFNL
jgi:hypothetical protein